MLGSIELRGLVLPARIGVYGPGDVVPDAHILDLVLSIDPALVLIDRDGMDRVFDYDPLVERIVGVARDDPYHTQERLITRIAEICAGCAPVRSVDILLSKRPVRDGSGQLGVRLTLDDRDIAALRAGQAQSRSSKAAQSRS